MIRESLIRRREARDDESISRLITHTILEKNTDIPMWENERMIAIYAPEHFPEIAKTREIYVLEEDGKIVATAGLTDDGEVAGVFTASDCAGRGYGTRMMEMILARAKEKGHTRVHLSASITAHSFYERFGFTDTGETHADGSVLEMTRDL